MDLAPIAIFVYNRPAHTKHTLDALRKNELISESDLYIFSDGPKENDNEENIHKISEVRKLISEINWCKSITIYEAEKNKGLAKSIIDGVTDVVNKHGKIIVLEDDLITSPYFLEFMNECLSIYKDISNIYSVNGFMFPIETEKAETVLLPYTSTWGWGTWKDKWAAFDSEMIGKELIIQNKYLSKRFNLADYSYTNMLNAGNNSWGIKWYYSVFCRNGLGVFPTKTLVQNIGFDGSGTNCKTESIAKVNLNNNVKITKNTVIDLIFYEKYLIHFKTKRKNIFKKILKKIFYD